MSKLKTTPAFDLIIQKAKHSKSALYFDRQLSQALPDLLDLASILATSKNEIL